MDFGFKNHFEIKLIIDVLVALECFQRCGLIHSDLKPENIVFRDGSDCSGNFDF